MATTISFNTYQDGIFYMNGQDGVTNLVGVDGDGQGNYVTRIARYSFTSPPEGGSEINIVFQINGLENNDYMPVPIRYYITTSDSSHKNAYGDNYAYTGELALSSNWSSLSDSAEIMLLPNTLYYIWVFPSSLNKYGLYWFTSDTDSTLQIFGSAGLVYIDNGTKFEAYQVYIDNGSKWELYIPYIDTGTEWVICS